MCWVSGYKIFDQSMALEKNKQVPNVTGDAYGVAYQRRTPLKAQTALSIMHILISSQSLLNPVSSARSWV